MNKLNIPVKSYNPEYPTDLVIIKDLPRAIREKAQEIINILLLLEESKVTPSIAQTLEYFPFIKSMFVQGNGQIPDAFYTKRGESWVGFGNYNYLPVIDANSKEGERVTLHGKTYELVLSNELKIWVEKPEYAPTLFYDFFTVPMEFITKDVENNGVGDKNAKFYLSNCKKFDRFFAPYIITSKNSESKTTAAIPMGNRFTFTSTFYEISREYKDGSEEVISPEHKSILMYIRDEFENVKVGICYDENNALYYFNKTLLTPLNTSITENNAYQISLQLHDNTVNVYLNDKKIFTTEDSVIKNKNLFFSIASDMFYGQYSNGAVIFGETSVFPDVLTPQEIRMIFENPRSFYLNNKNETYLDLDLKDKILLKSFIEDKKQDLNNNSIKKDFYLGELKLASLYETEVLYGMADSSYRPEIKTYLEELKLGINENLVRPSILNEYK